MNPTLYTPANLAKRIKDDNAFVTKVLSQPKIWLIGNEENELSELSELSEKYEDKLNVKPT